MRRENSICQAFTILFFLIEKINTIFIFNVFEYAHTALWSSSKLMKIKKFVLVVEEVKNINKYFLYLNK